MTEEEWLDASDPSDLLDAVRQSPNSKRIWSYVIACLEGIGDRETARLIATRISGSADQNAFAERRNDLQIQSGRVSGGGYSMGRKPVHASASSQRARAGIAALDPIPQVAAQEVTRETRHLLQREQCAWLRCLHSNPFRPITLDPAWLTPTVLALAEGIYTDKAFDRMPVLADALEEAGCVDTDILLHCRGDGPHVRGCWVVDLILGKE